MHAISLPVARDLYALPVVAVREVVAAGTTTPVPTAPGVVVGVFNLRGQIVPLLNTAELLGTASIEHALFFVVVDRPQGPVALTASGVPEPILLDQPNGASELPGTAGLFRVGQQVVTLLDPDVLLTVQAISGGRVPRRETTAGVS